MPRLVRHRSWTERLRDRLNPYDLWIRISEELETSDYPWDQWAYVAGIVCNFVFMLARANSASTPYDDIFDEEDGRSFFKALAIFLTWSLIISSLSNALYTFLRKRHYRLFERSVEGAPPSTPSARRVRVDSSPSHSPLKYLASFLQDDSARSRAHADSKRDVWEIAVWDPLPVNLRFFCTFSPGHVLIYWLYIPVAYTDPRPSTTIATAVSLAALLSVQLVVMQMLFSQQSKDTSYVQREVINEYDTKYVHPRTQPSMRDVGVQFDEENKTLNTIEEYAPVTIISRGFKPNPNPNYTSLVDPDHGLHETPTRPNTMFAGHTPPRNPSSDTPSTAGLRQSQGPRDSVRPGDGGYLGVYTHARSPLKNAQLASGRQSTGVGPDGVLPKRSNRSTGGPGYTPRFPRYVS